MLLRAVLPSGCSEIDVFGDGSCQPLLGLGSWAFCSPGLGIADVGLESGSGIENFEILAALAGLEKVLLIDHTRRPIRLHSDSQFALLFLQYAVERTALPSRRSFDRVRDLHRRASDLTTGRKIVLTRVEPTRPEHMVCHRNAAGRLRQALAADPVLSSRFALRKEEDRLQSLAEERSALQRKLDKLEEETILANARIQALSYASRSDSTLSRAR